MSEILESKLRSQSNRLKRIAASDRAVAMLASVYEKMADLVAAPPLELDGPIDFPDLEFLSDPLSAPVRKLFTDANAAFRIQSPDAMRSDLSDLLADIRKLDGRNSIVQALEVMIKRWLAALERKHSSVHVSVVPFSDGAEQEVDSAESGFISRTKVSIENSGLLQAFDVELFIVAGTDGHVVEVLDAQPMGGDLWAMAVADSLQPGTSSTISLKVRHRAATELTVFAQYNQSRGLAPRCSSESLCVRLPVARGAGQSGLGNPFIPDLPLPSFTFDGNLNPLMKEEREQIVSRILTDSMVLQGRVYVIRGVRRSGKTSLLLGLEARMKREARFLPVYIDICSWYLNLTSPINRDELLYELADAAARVASQFSASSDAQEIDDGLEKHQDEMALRVEAFGTQMEKIRKVTHRRVAFLIDELDWWINRDKFEDAQQILKILVDFSVREKCAIVLAHDWTTGGWEKKYGDERLQPIILDLGFLSRAAFDSLVSQCPVPLTAPAAEYLWRLTGGWPGLIQVVCYELSRAITENPSEKKGIIDTELVSRAVDTILSSSNWQGTVAKLLKSFSKDELKFLVWLAGSGRLEQRGGAIRGLRYSSSRGFWLSPRDEAYDSKGLIPILASLIQKQILEKRDREQGAFALRVGFFQLGAFLSLRATEEAEK